MKLNGLSVDTYGICKNLRFDNFENGLNLIYGSNGSGKSTLARYIRNVLYGFEYNETDQLGYLDVVSEGIQSKLVRNSDTSNQLTRSSSRTANGYNDNRERDFVPAEIDAIGRNVFDAAFFVDGRNSIHAHRSLADLLEHQFHVPTGRSGVGNNSEYERLAHSMSGIQSRLDSLSRTIAGLEVERQGLARQIDNECTSSDSRRQLLDDKIRSISSQIDRLNLSGTRILIETLDREIADLRIQIETSQDRVEYVSRPYKQSDGLAILYRRLDEIDNQIRRWRSVHADVQNQRVQLKDEMLVWNDMKIDSAGHPYKRSREILGEIESKVALAENSINDLRKHRIDDPRTTGTTADQLFTLCGQIRGDLYALCDELGTQYKTVRHRSAAAELKRLRRCYHEIGENIDALINHRNLIIDEIHQLDPAGALAVARTDNEFCSCAQHEGYLQARRKYVGELTNSEFATEVIRSDVSSETARLKELENLRAARVRELVALENSFSDLDAQRRSLTDERNRLDSAPDFNSLESRLAATEADLKARLEERMSLESDLLQLQSIRPEPANELLGHANEQIGRLTRGEIRIAWLSNPTSVPGADAGIEVEDRHGQQFTFARLGSGIQQQVVLGLSLAVVQYYRRSGTTLPLILDDVFVNLDPELIHATFDTLNEFSHDGTQVVALTSDQTALNLARHGRTTVFDLPDTSISPTVPMWTPDRVPLAPAREPEFLTPFTTRQHISAPERPISYPQIKYPATGHRIDHSHHNFDRDTVATATPSHRPYVEASTVFDDETELSILNIADRDQLDRLRHLGIATVGQLLDVNPHELPARFAERRITSNDLDTWQSLAWLMICVPDLNVDDAQILSALGIIEPEQLESTHSQQLLDRISRYLNSPEGRRFADLGRGFNRDTINRWYDSLGQTRSRWRMPSGYSRRNRWQPSSSSSGDRNERIQRDRGERRNFETKHPQRDGRTRRERRNRDDRFDSVTSRFGQRNDRTSLTGSHERDGESNRSTGVAETSTLKFYLDLADPLEAAPSIGPKTAERFLKVGIRTVGEFLAQTAELIAPKVNYKRISVDVIRLWQHQARMVCRIPNLRGHDAQLLVACGITEPEDLANRSPKKLFSMIEPFSESKEGLKIIRGGKQPDLDEISNWVNWAQQTRSLQAA